MHRYEALEKLYYKKKYFKLFFRMVIIIFIIIGSFFIYNLQYLKKENQTIIKKDKKQLNQTITLKKDKNITHKQKKEIIKVKQKIVPKEVKKLVLYPIFPDINISKIQSEKKLTKKEVINKSSIIVQKTQKTAPKINIIVKSEKQTLKNMIDSFAFSKDYNIALKIAKVYFEKKNYEKSIQWSKKANEINPEDSQSWYIFAKSLIKLGKTKKAKEVLIAYLNTYGADEKIENLLRSLK